MLNTTVTAIRRMSLLALLCLIFSGVAWAQEEESIPTKGVIRMKIKEKDLPYLEAQLRQIESSQISINQTGIQEFDQFNTQFQTKSIKRVFREAGKFEERHRAFGLHQWYEIETDSLNEVEALLASFGSLEMVEKVEPKMLCKLFGEPMSTAPSDPFFQKQWHYDNQGQSGGTSGADINLLKAWGIETGSPDVVVGVIDGGIDVNHPDLMNRLWVNTGEIPGNGIDDDGNGFVDDVYGWNFADNMPTIIPHTHGTHVAGTIGAETNNGIGVAGVAGGSGPDDGIRMMSLQVFSNYLQWSTQGGFEEAFIYAADMGAVITNNSWGFPDATESEIQKDAIRYFIAMAGRDDEGNAVGPVDGGVVIFAAGNFGYNPVYTRPAYSFPSIMEEVISVSNVDHNDQKALSSYWNETIDIAAPGSNIYSTYPNGAYVAISGTSMAAPHVTGVAALVASNNAYQITADQIRSRLIDHSANIDYLNTSFVGKIGKGRLDAYAALVKDEGQKPNTIENWGFYSIGSIGAQIGWMLVTDAFGLTVQEYEILLAEGEFTQEESAAFENAASVMHHSGGTSNAFMSYIFNGLMPTTTYSLAVRGVDQFGNRAELSEIMTFTTTPSAEVSWVEESPIALEVDLDGESNPQATMAVKNTGEWPSRVSFRLNDFQMEEEPEMTNGRLSAFSTESNAVIPFSDHPEPSAIPFNASAGNFSNTTTASDPVVIMPTYKAIDSLHHDQEYMPNFMAGNGGGTTEFLNKFTAPRDMKIGALSAFLCSEMYTEVSYTLAIYVGGDDRPITTPVHRVTVRVDDQRGKWYSASFSRDVAVAEGEVFWISVLSPQGVFYPLGGENVTSSYRGKSYVRRESHNYFQDFGSAQRMLFKIRAFEVLKTNSLVTFDPNFVVVESGESRLTTMTIKGNEWYDGVYNLQLIASHDDPMQGPLSRPVTLTVKGNKPEIVITEDAVDFSTLYLNKAATRKFLIRNEGKALTDTLRLTVGDSEYFEVSPAVINPIVPGKGVEVTVKAVAQSEVGTVSGILEIHKEEEETERLVLSAHYIKGAFMEVDQAEFEWVDENAIPIGETRTAKFTVTNTGDRDGEFIFSSFEDGKSSGYIQFLTPYKGFLKVGESMEVEAFINTEGLKDNGYNSSRTTYYDFPVGRGSLKFSVQLIGEAIIEVPEKIHFGESVYQEGLEITQSIAVKNTGNAKASFQVKSISEGYTISGYVPSSISAGGVVNLKVIAQLPGVGEHSGDLTISVDNTDFTIALSVEGLESPEMNVRADNFLTSATMAYGALGEQTSLVVSNTSETESLNFVVSTPAWLNLQDDTPSLQRGDGNFGYSFEITEGVEWLDISEQGRELFQDMVYPDYITTYHFDKFNFPFYGEIQRQIRISSAGVLSFNGGIPDYAFGNAAPFPGYDINEDQLAFNADLGVISAFWMRMYASSEGGIYLLEEEDRLIIQFDDMWAVMAGPLTPYTQTSIQVILTSDGGIELSYKQLPTAFTYQIVGMKNSTGDLAWQYMESNADFIKEILGKTIKVKAPKLFTLNPNEELSIDMQYNAASTAVGSHEYEMTVYSDDVNQPSWSTNVQLEVTGEAQLSTVQEQLEFNDVIYALDSAFEQTLPIDIRNEGSLPVMFSASFKEGDSFTCTTDTLPLGAFDQVSLSVRYQALTDEVTYDTLVLAFDNATELTLPVVGDAKSAPYLQYVMDYTSRQDTIDILVNQGQLGQYAFQLSNIGKEMPLDYDVTLGLTRYGWSKASEQVVETRYQLHPMLA
ncbi:S8 family serine peptidase [Persicobacter sp. CCB-QB2]|uniref:S8 family serine peptidase n=1 Tax=Persicobacter sp. CCB-QB2 TaxID=1561025 RepID=UPI0009E18AAB|nr:S8 family serine peptidase [Persicobacter sp. CCB-QB2]